MFIKLIVSFLFSISLFGSYTTEFYQSFETLKSEHWSELAELGEKALEENSDPKIHARLASSYFYLGNYDKMKTHIDACFDEILDEKSDKLLIRNLYLLSAYHRSQEDYSTAQKVINKALTKARLKNNPKLLSKVLFNAGAACADDPKGDLDLAQNYYEEALSYLPKNSDDTHRLLIRLGKVHLLKKEFKPLDQIINTLSQTTLALRTEVHFYYLAAQASLEKNAQSEAKKWIEQGLNLAEKLQMSKDYQRLESLKSQTL